MSTEVKVKFGQPWNQHPDCLDVMIFGGVEEGTLEKFLSHIHIPEKI